MSGRSRRLRRAGVRVARGNSELKFSNFLGRIMRRSQRAIRTSATGLKIGHAQSYQAADSLLLPPSASTRSTSTFRSVANGPKMRTRRSPSCPVGTHRHRHSLSPTPRDREAQKLLSVRPSPSLMIAPAVRRTRCFHPCPNSPSPLLPTHRQRWTVRGRAGIRPVLVIKICPSA